jgi:hypothetical protein
VSFSFGRKESDRKSDMAEKSPKERERNEKEKKLVVSGRRPVTSGIAA